jgi:penicillin-binding protein-related factor A (putative recombinase)
VTDPERRPPPLTRRDLANKGQGLENVLEKIVHPAYARKGLARVYKFPTPWKPIPSVIQGRKVLLAVPAEQALADWIGALYNPDRAVAFETKENHGEKDVKIPGARKPKSFAFDRRWEHEVEFLADMTQAGWATFFLIENLEHVPGQLLLGRPKEVLVPRVIPFRDHFLPRWKAAFPIAGTPGRRSIALEDLLRFPIVHSAPGIPIDWLPTVLSLGSQL